MPVASSISDTAPALLLVTQTVRAAGSTATPTGPLPTGMVRVTVPVTSSITDTAPAMTLLAAQTVREAGSAATPIGWLGFRPWLGARSCQPGRR